MTLWLVFAIRGARKVAGSMELQVLLSRSERGLRLRKDLARAVGIKAVKPLDVLGRPVCLICFHFYCRPRQRLIARYIDSEQLVFHFS